MESLKTLDVGRSSRTSILKKDIFQNVSVPQVLVAGLMALAAGLLFYNLRSNGDANAYYTAAVKSMLQSWHNFFFVAAEPGGSLTVDKPPLGLWIEAVFAFFFGVSGVTTALPNLLAGVLEVPVLYLIVKKYMGELAGLLAALVLVLTPAFVSTHRHNTFDGMLSLTVLLAAWAFINATESGQFRWLLLGGFLMGVGFNIKMAEVLLPLPAFYALYFFGSKVRWVQKAFNLFLATSLFGAIALSWAVVVDRTPSDQRPFIGSTATNTVLELMFENNAAARIFNLRTPRSNDPAIGPGPQAVFPKFNGTIGTFEDETGQPGLLRFFVPPLSKEMSWVLPFALISLLLALFGAHLQLPVEAAVHKSLILWGSWLLICVVFFSLISGIFHAYYTIMAVPPMSAMTGIGFARLWEWGKEKKWTAILLLLVAAGTLAYQRIALAQYQDRIELSLVAAGFLILGALLTGLGRRNAYFLVFAALLLIPAYWSLMTALSNANQTFPDAYRGGRQSLAPEVLANDPNLRANQRLLSYLQANTQDVKYLVAVPSAMQGDPLVLTSERPVLYMGGFGGLDRVIEVNKLTALVAKGDLRYVLYAKYFRRPGGTGRADPKILAWLKQNCLVVPKFSQVIVYSRHPRQTVSLENPGNTTAGLPRNDYLTLYLCP
jgi:4-amino-4-deoxy-L-arabinose transferase-like glycosyltransferase